MTDETRRQIGEDLEKLRWSLAGARAGGISGWARAQLKKADPQPDSNAEHAVKEPGGAGQTSAPPTPPISNAPPAAARINKPANSSPQTSATAPAAKVIEPPTIQAAASLTTAPPTAGNADVGDSNEKLAEINRSLVDCTRCRLHSGRTNLVFGEGSANSGIVFVGEGPGSDEDRLGRPFVGRAGKLLDKMILAMSYRREDVYICNVVKCRPPENRAPLQDEAEACSPFLLEQIDALKPKVICALGASAAQCLLQTTKFIGQLRGKVHLWHGIPLICTYHPAYLLRSPMQKAAAWKDLKEILRILRDS